MMVHPMRVRHVPCVVGQQCRGLRTSRKGRPSNRVWRYQRNTTKSSPPSLRLRLTLRNYRPATDKTLFPPSSDHIQQNPPHTQHNYALVSDQPPRRSNPYVTVSSLHRALRPYASESLVHTCFDPRSLSERQRYSSLYICASSPL